MGLKKCSFCYRSNRNSDVSVFHCTSEILERLTFILDKDPDTYPWICSEHFSECSFAGGPHRKRLKANSIPNRFYEEVLLDHPYNTDMEGGKEDDMRASDVLDSQDIFASSAEQSGHSQDIFSASVDPQGEQSQNRSDPEWASQFSGTSTFTESGLLLTFVTFYNRVLQRMKSL